MRLLLLSDTHSLHRSLDPLPDADIVLHAGDVSGYGTLPEIADFLGWFGALPHQHKVFIAGNHDFGFEREAAAAEALVPAGVTYLRDNAIEIEGLTIWGSRRNTPAAPTCARGSATCRDFGCISSGIFTRGTARTPRGTAPSSTPPSATCSTAPAIRRW